MAGSLPSPNLKVLNREKETVSLEKKNKATRTPGDSDGGWLVFGGK